MHVDPADLVRDIRGVKEPRATGAAVSAQGGRPLERRNGNGQRAAPDRPVGRSVEERRHGLVGNLCRCRSVPGCSIEVVHDSRQGRVSTMLVGDRRALLDCRPHERVAEAERRAVDHNQSRGDGGRQGRRPARRPLR